ncbi:hypothetical protein GCM10009839_12200 [Catenulispora yoronensis]|uniref:SnoaL-like domain-containing protein n=1 Tax=Catenulispora yoronensis TaxID=450799 RepID=A0ABN2TQZ0_9ACTN
MTNTAATTTDLTADFAHVVDRYLAVWTVADPDDRAKAVADLWTPDGVEFVEGNQYYGHAALTDRVAEAHEAFIATGAYTASGGDDATRHDDIVVFTIRLDHATEATGPVGETAWSARVFLALAEDGRISEDYQLTVKPLVVP